MAKTEFSGPLKVAGTEIVDVNGNVVATLTGTLTGEIGTSGSAAAAGGSATVNTRRGTLTTDSLTTASASIETIDLVNSELSAGIKLFVQIGDYSGSTGLPVVGEVVTTTAGSATISIINASTTAPLNGSATVHFFVLD